VLPSRLMIHLLMLAVHRLATIAKLLGPGGVRAVVAESLLLKHQLVIGSRARRRAPNLNSFDRFVLGLGSLFVPASRIPKLAVILKPRTLLRFHEALKKCKYRRVLAKHYRPEAGPAGPSWLSFIGHMKDSLWSVDLFRTGERRGIQMCATHCERALVTQPASLGGIGTTQLT
jgi:hypothetical protein